MSNAAAVHRRAPAKRDIRAARTGNARDAIGTLEPGAEVYILTHGQFSLIDALIAVVEQTGPANVTLSTWTAAAADLTTAARLLEGSQIRSLRFLVDRSFLTRQPDYCATMRRLFGDDCIRTTRTHAKFATIRNESWSIAIRTSMNLNENPRLENIEISDDPGLCGFLEDAVDQFFRDQQPGLFDGELPDAPPTHGVTMGAVSTTGLRAASAGPRTSPATA